VAPCTRMSIRCLLGTVGVSMRRGAVPGGEPRVARVAYWLPQRVGAEEG
jgi:hypothetical protein